MCTVIVALGVSDRWPVILAANRDERLARPSATWQRSERPDVPALVAPRDLQAGGTWIGMSSRGVVAAVTNRYTGQPPDGSLRSRGELVDLVLRSRSASEAQAVVAEINGAHFNPFHLVVADATGGWLWAPRDPAVGLCPLTPGVHVITEQSALGTDARSTLVARQWPENPTLPSITSLLTIHGEHPLDSTCIHLGDVYGTRSSSVVFLGKTLRESQLWVTDGPPCLEAYRDCSGLLR